MSTSFPSSDKKHQLKDNRPKKNVTFSKTRNSKSISPVDENNQQHKDFLENLRLTYSQNANKLNNLISQKENEI